MKQIKETEANPKREAKQLDALCAAINLKRSYTLEELLARFTTKSVKQILKDGTLEEKGWLLVAYMQSIEWYPQIPKLIELHEKIQYDEPVHCMLGEYELVAYLGANLCIAYLRYVDTARKLLYDIKIVDMLKVMASHLNVWYKEAKEQGRAEALNTYTTFAKFFEAGKEKGKVRYKIAYDEESDTFAVDAGSVDDPRSLARDIRMQRLFTREYLREIKARMEQIEKRLKRRGQTRSFLPIDVEQIMEAIEDEVICKEMDIPAIYLQSELNRRLMAREVVTAQEKARAVYPDFQSLTIPEDERAKCVLEIGEFIRANSLYYLL